MIISGNQFTQSAQFQQPGAACCGSCGPEEKFEKGGNWCGTSVPSRADVLKAAASEETVSVAVSNAQTAIEQGEITSVQKARGIPQTDFHVPATPGPFRSVETTVTFESTANECGVEMKNTAAVLFDTGLSHLAPVTPGETRCPGSVSVNGTPCNNKEIDRILESLYRRFSGEMTQQEANDLNYCIGAAMAVRHQNDNPGVVAAHHQQLLGELRQPAICPQE